MSTATNHEGEAEMSNETDEHTDDESELPELPVLARAAAAGIVRQTMDHPWRALAVAAGVGYVLARGLPGFVVRMGVLAAGRLIGTAALGNVLSSFTGAIEESVGEGEASTDEANRTRPRRNRAGRRRAGRAQESN